jgi:hypothetical protein
MGIVQRIVAEGGKLLNVWGQPSQERAAILEANQAARHDRLGRRMAWGEPTLRIPELDLHKLKLANPDLAHPDGQIRARAWKRFAASPEAAPYRLRERTGGATNRVFMGGS